jgi:hypothetical protein
VAKRLLIWAVIGAALGNALGVVAAVQFLPYWYRPPGVSEQDRCVSQIDSALTYMAKIQGIAAAVGLLLFLVLGVLWMRGRKKAEPPNPAVPAGGGTTTPTV